jgi:DNA-binding NarL/FixJ family response regulator
MQSQIKAIKLMINNVGEDLAVDRALRTGMLAILDTIEPEQEQKQPEPEPKPEKKPKKNTAKELDIGKIKSLREAGWTLAGIAREMGVSQQTIANHLKKVGMK